MLTSSHSKDSLVRLPESCLESHSSLDSMKPRGPTATKSPVRISPRTSVSPRSSASAQLRASSSSFFVSPKIGSLLFARPLQEALPPRRTLRVHGVLLIAQRLGWVDLRRLAGGQVGGHQ